MKKLFLLFAVVCLPALAQNFDQPQGFGTSGQAIRFDVKADRGARRFEYVYGGSLSTVSTVLKGCMRGGDTCDTIETSTSTSNTSRCVNDIYDYYTVTPTFTGGTAPTLTVYMTSGPSAVCASGQVAASPLNKVQGMAADGATATGNPVQAGGVDASGNAQVFATDTTGRLVVGTANAQGDGLFAATQTLTVACNTGTTQCITPAFGSVNNGTNWDRQRSADLTTYNTATTTTAANSIGAQLEEKGSRWSVIHNPAAGSQATASIASEASVRHVVDCVSFSAASTTAPVLTALTINVRDGATGAGTIIWTYQVVINAGTGQNVAPHSVCGLNLTGTTATAMTVEFSASLANLIESVSISGFNVN